jgi:hypothetical protein
MDVRSYPFERLDRLELNPQYVDVRAHEPLCPVRMQYARAPGWSPATRTSGSCRAIRASAGPR